MMRNYLPLLAVLLCFWGCPRSQKYARPDLPVPASWPDTSVSPAAGASGAPMAADVGWREFFVDARLQSVIELALTHNRDLRMATLNIQKVEAMYRIQSAERVPHLNASVGAEGYRIPANLSSNDRASTVTQYTVGLGLASWELDLFGRVRNLKSRVLEQYLATEQARSATQISLVAAIAHSYLAMAANRENLRLAQATLEAQQASYDLILRTRELGMASDLDVSYAQTQVDAAKVDIIRYTGQIRLDENALQLLVGAPVGADMLSDELGKIAAWKDVSAGLPSEALLRRPDILMAEHQLKAASANIEAARATFFPRIALTAATGVISSDLNGLFKLGAGTWSFAPQAVLPLFDAGARQANYQVVQTDRDIAVAEYEKAIQTAFREIADALSRQATLATQQKAQQVLVSDMEETYRLCNARYQQGIDGYLGVLVAQRSLYAAQQGLLGVRLADLSNRVTLYKALGGGGVTDKATGSLPVSTK